MQHWMIVVAVLPLTTLLISECVDQHTFSSLDTPESTYKYSGLTDIQKSIIIITNDTTSNTVFRSPPDSTYITDDGETSTEELTVDTTTPAQQLDGLVISAGSSDNNNNPVDPLNSAAVNCNPGYYLPSGSFSCIMCETGTYTGAQPTEALSSCIPCPAGTFGGGVGNTQCVPCPAASFSYFTGSSVCSSCPPWTGSSPGMSECVTCSSSAGCLYSGIPTRNCPRCDSACMLCKPGYYNDGTSTGCIACGPGKFNPISGASSSAQCQVCVKGTYTKPTSVGMTTCLSCDSGLQKPVANTFYIDSTDGEFDPLLCKWGCDQGFKYMSSNILPDSTLWNAYYSSFTGPSQLYSDTQARVLIGLRTNYCCDVRQVDTGMFLDGCDKTHQGSLTDCNPIPNGYHVYGEAGDLISRCGFWECNNGYYKLGDQCVEQPVCEEGYTYRRTTDGLLVVGVTGVYTCILCPVCVDGSETIMQCNRTHSPECRMCGGAASYSVNGGPCVENVPYGYRGVTRQLDSVPAWGERPRYFSNGVDFVWDKNMIFFSFVKCADVGIGLSYTVNQEDCKQESNSACDQCSTECSRWKRTGGWFEGDGWFQASNGQCQKCEYDSSRCDDFGAYLDMSVCGASNPPSCAIFRSGIGFVAGQENWANPRRSDFNGIYPCEVVCKKGFMEFNSTCIDCTSLPDFPSNAVPINGCTEWTCPRGFIKSGNLCETCPVASACGVGFFPGYSAENNVCLSCVQCYKPINATFLSNGTKEGGYRSCSYRCNENWFMTSDDECQQCTKQSCQVGTYFLKPCAATSNSDCIRCRICTPGFIMSQPCTLNSDAVCSPCNASNSNNLPANAIWDGAGCRLWKCMDGSWYNGSACVSCKIASQCSPNERLEMITACTVIASNAGKCVPCNPLDAGMCFTGDGLCGSIPCAYTNENGKKTTTASSSSSAAMATTKKVTTSISATPVPTTTSYSVAVVKTSAFATVAALNMDVVEKVTPVLLKELVKTVSDFVCAQEVGSFCNVSVLSITENNKTVFCVKGVCPGYTSRRVLLEIRGSSVNVGIVTEQAVADISSLFDLLKGVASYKVMPNAQVTNVTAILDAGVFLKLVTSNYTEYNRRVVRPGSTVIPAAEADSTVFTVVGAVVAVVAVVVIVQFAGKKSIKRDGTSNMAVQFTPPDQSITLRLGTHFASMVNDPSSSSSKDTSALESIRITKDNYKPYVKTA